MVNIKRIFVLLLVVLPVSLFGQDWYNILIEELHLNRPLCQDSMIIIEKNYPTIEDTIWVDRRTIKVEKVLTLLDSLLYDKHNDPYIIEKLKSVLVLFDSRYTSQYGFITSGNQYPAKVENYLRRRWYGGSGPIKSGKDQSDIIDKLEHTINIFKLLDEDELEIFEIVFKEKQAPQLKIAHARYQGINLGPYIEYIRKKLFLFYPRLEELTRSGLSVDEASTIVSILVPYTRNYKIVKCDELSKLIELDESNYIINILDKGGWYYRDIPCVDRILKEEKNK